MLIGTNTVFDNESLHPGRPADAEHTHTVRVVG